MFMCAGVFPLLGGQTMLPKAVTPAKPATTQGLGPVPKVEHGNIHRENAGKTLGGMVPSCCLSPCKESFKKTGIYPIYQKKTPLTFH